MSLSAIVNKLTHLVLWTSCWAIVLADAREKLHSGSCHHSCGAFTCRQLLQADITCDHMKKLNCDCGSCCMAPSPPCQNWRKLQSGIEPEFTAPAAVVAPSAAPPSAAPPSTLVLGSPEQGQFLRQAFLDAEGQGFELELPEDGILTLDAELVVAGANVSLLSPGRGATLDGNGLTRIFHVHSGGRLFLQNVRLTNASVANQSNTPGAPHGGAVLIEGPGSLLSLRDVTMEGATALMPEAAGGGVAAYEGAVLEMVDCKIFDCTCAADGGGIFVQV
eukprot:5361200-Pleurochrysis_carterae.AAC.2